MTLVLAMQWIEAYRDLQDSNTRIFIQNIRNQVAGLVVVLVCILMIRKVTILIIVMTIF